jgi:hypothetical protein
MERGRMIKNMINQPAPSTSVTHINEPVGLDLSSP